MNLFFETNPAFLVGILILAAVAVLMVISGVFYVRSKSEMVEKEALEPRDMMTGYMSENTCVNHLNSEKGNPSMLELAVIYLDLINFRFIIEKHGADVGERVLQECVRVMNENLREGEMLARHGSDHFVAVVDRKNTEAFLKAATGMHLSFEMKGQHYSVPVSASAGVYYIDDDSVSGEEAIENAFATMYYGKTVMKKKVTYMTPALKEGFREWKRFVKGIPDALRDEEFQVYYQPKVNSRTGMLCGAEALIRWHHEGEVITPGKFISALETSDHMREADFYMLRHTCSDMAGWLREGKTIPRISVNLSRSNLSNPKLAEEIDAVVQEYRIPKALLEIEIVESADEFPISVLRSFADELHKLGYRLAVDDFGCGDSSLNLLREVDIDTLKIDKDFVDQAYDKDLIILEHIIKLARALKIEVLAEGVEKKKQVDTLRSIGCEIIQGYYYDKPLVRGEFEERMASPKYEMKPEG